MPYASPLAEHLFGSDETERLGAHRRPSNAYQLADPATPETVFGPEETRRLVAAAISGLTPQHQQLMTLRYQDDLNFEQIAAEWNVTPEAVCQMHKRAISRLRESFALMGCLSWSEVS